MLVYVLVVWETGPSLAFIHLYGVTMLVSTWVLLEIGLLPASPGANHVARSQF
jgi:uncharacterized membrane protein YhaH (DUF805 family)